MAQRPNKLSQFWQELKRRRVAHVITVYASAAWVLIQLVNNLTEPLNLPTGLATIMVIVLAVGFPLTIILSWIYDLTSEGIEKTKPLSEIYEKEKTVVPNAWKIATYVSFVVILGLVTFNILKGTSGLRSGDIQSLLILPFDNFTGDETLDYVAAGMHSSLIGDMGQISALRVISKKTASVYKTIDMSLPQIAKEINMGAVIEPSVMCYGDSVCIQIRVITMNPEEKQLWVAEYKEEKSQVLNLYSKISKQIANDLMIKLTPEEKRIFAKSRTIDRDAYDDYLRSNGLLGPNRDSLNKAKDYLNSAIEKDPDWAPLYSGLANVWVLIQQLGFEPTSVTSPEIYKNLNKALELDPNLSEAHASIAVIAHWMEWDWEKSEKEFLKALAVNPNDAMSRVLYGQLLCGLQRTDEGIAQGRLAFELDPLNPMIKVSYGGILLGTGDCKTALVLAEEITAAIPGELVANSLIEGAAFQCKEYDKMIKTERYLLPMYDVKEEEIKEIERIFNEQGVVMAYEKIMKHLEEYSENNHIGPINMAIRYMYANQPDKAMDWIEKGFEQHDPKTIYIASIFDFDPLFNNPRFIAICKKMNLPMPTTN